MIVRAPGSSANLGPGFDALGVAVGIHAEVGTEDEPQPDDARLVDEHHPATKAFRLGGGRGPVWCRSRLPMGRGLGYSGAVRVAGLVAGMAQDGGRRVLDDPARRHEVLRLATELEGHGDNVAASLLGGFVATAGGHAVRIPLGFAPSLVVWVPSITTSTDESRGRLPGTVSFADAVFNVGRVSLLVAALAAGRPDALRVATVDRLHQDVRFTMVPRSAEAARAAEAAGAWCAWLSGSGPTVAAMCAPELADAVVAALPPDGAGRVVALDLDGAVVLG